MATINEIRSAITILESGTLDKKDIILLHCTTAYPAPMAEVNLRAIKTLEKEFNLSVGYSDHTLGIEISLAAVAIGAIVIEKHFTLDRGMDGPDHLASLETAELKKMIESIRNIESALGNGEKKPTPSEIINMAAARKSIIAAKNIKKGEVFNEENLAIKRPGNGLSPMLWNKIIGCPATKDYREDDLIEMND